ncbi:MAG TPA: Crp/Fnr family transcriptional regulator [Burkholderiales bacterium]|nr:Crp/Fnr family transcriptional regulator [Burkholderiales bacterium]
MREASSIHVRGRNRLLELLPGAERERLVAATERITTKFGDLVFERNEPIVVVHFPLCAVVSVAVVMEDGAVAEAGTVGNEGVTGLPLLFGGQRSPNRAFYQVPGEALRMPARMFVDELAKHGALREVVQRYAQAYLTQVSQATACNRLHAVEQRLCRWILMSHDRVGAEALPLTQEMIAQMLGVRRASVSVVAGRLQKAGLIRYNRGVITVLNRTGLESCTCECYRVVRTELERLLG